MAFTEFIAVINTSDLPGLGPEVRLSAQPSAVLAQAVDALGLDGTAAGLAKAAALLWHDHLDESHSVSQDIGSTDGSFLHGIMHRREPDYSNAKYWFHRVGDHHCFPALASPKPAANPPIPPPAMMKGFSAISSSLRPCLSQDYQKA